MRKNSSMRMAAILMVLTLITSCFTGGTFAKYVTTATGESKATIAKWGFENGGISTTEVKGFFDHDNVNVKEGTIGPGTSGGSVFKIASSGEGGPDVGYQLSVDTEGSTASMPSRLKWYFGTTALTNVEDESAYTMTWETVLEKIEEIGGTYEANTLPASANYYINWIWPYEGDDAADTEIGNTLGGTEVVLKLTITASQLAPTAKN